MNSASQTPTAVKRPNLTDAGNAARFALQHRGWARYCYAWRTWLIWSGHHWRRDPGDGAMRMAKATAEGIFLEVASVRSDEERRQLAKWAIASESEPRLRAMLTLAQSEPGIPVTPDDLDTDPMLLGCENGTIELRTGTLRPARREDLITKSVPVAFDPAAACPTFLAFLERIFAGNGRVIGFLQRAIGYSLTGDTSEQCLFILWGPTGANGKSTLLVIAVTMLGEYAVSTRPETFMVKKGETIPNDVAQLKGARLVVAVEAEAGHRLAEGFVKQATGGDRLTARFMRAEYFSFDPTFKIFLATNHRPQVRGGNPIFRRIKLVPFSVTIPDDQQDHHLTDKLKAELPGILAWAVRGCLDWQRGGLGEPEEVRAATAAYRADMDVLGGFLRDACVVSPQAQVASGPLYQSYEAWAHTNGERALSKRTFGLRLSERGFTHTRTKEERRWEGLRLRSAMDPLGDVMTEGDAASPMNSHTRAREELRENTCHQASSVTDAAQEEMPKWVTEGLE